MAWRFLPVRSLIGSSLYINAMNYGETEKVFSTDAFPKSSVGAAPTRTELASINYLSFSFGPSLSLTSDDSTFARSGLCFFSHSAFTVTTCRAFCDFATL